MNATEDQSEPLGEFSELTMPRVVSLIDRQAQALSEIRALHSPSKIVVHGIAKCMGCGGQHPDQREGHSRQLIDYALLHGTTQWGKYAPAIHRWEALTRPAPAPTEPNTKGNPRLAAPFPEWMMGWPDGWCTAPEIGLSRNDALRIIGNGVCVQQCVAALRQLLPITRLFASLGAGAS